MSNVKITKVKSLELTGDVEANNNAVKNLDLPNSGIEAAGTTNTHNETASAHANLSARAPAAHASTHHTGGADALTAANVGGDAAGTARPPTAHALAAHDASTYADLSAAVSDETLLISGDNGDQSLTFRRLDTTQMIVAGAGSAEVDGTYTQQEGELNGKPWYKHSENSLLTIEWWADRWQIVLDPLTEIDLYEGVEDVATPNLVETWTVTDNGTAPAPTVDAAIDAESTHDPDGLKVKDAVAGNLGSFDAQGRLIDGGDAPSDYDPAGAANTVQGNLNTHTTTHPAPTDRDARNAELPETQTLAVDGAKTITVTRPETNVNAAMEATATVTLADPPVTTRPYSLRVYWKQDGTGDRVLTIAGNTLGWGTYTLSTGANAKDYAEAHWNGSAWVLVNARYAIT